MDELRINLNGLKREKQNQFLVLNSQLQDLQTSLENLRTTVKYEQEEKYHQEDKQKNVLKELSQISVAIKNIYNRCASTMSTAKPTMINNSSSIILGLNNNDMNENHKSNHNININNSNNSRNNGLIINQMIDKNLLIMTEKLDYYLDVMKIRMKDLIDISEEYRKSVVSGTLTSLVVGELRRDASASSALS